MRSAMLRLLPLLFAAAAVATPAVAQFGKNKITYDRFSWQVYQSPHFDVYYYAAEEPFLEEVVSYAESAYVKLSQEFDHELRWRVPMIMYKTHAEFEQTNVQLSDISTSTLAFAEPIQNRMVFPIDTPPDFLYALITHELTHIFQFSMFFEGSIGRVIRSSPPLWLMEGLASYMAEDESSIDQMVIRDAVVNNILPPVQALDLSPFFAYRYGHAVFDFIEQEHGREGLRTFIFEYRKVLLTNNIPKAIEDAFGYEIDEFNRRFNRFLMRRYFPVLLEKKSPDDYGRQIGAREPGIFTFSPALSPSGALVAALSTQGRELDLFVLEAEDGKKVRNVTKGWTNKYEFLVAEAFKGKRDLAWSPAGDDVAVFARRENKRVLLIYDALKGKLKRKIDLGDVVQGAAPAYSPDGSKIAFEGNRNGVVDIFEYELQTGDIRNLTDDDQFDTNPAYSSDGSRLIYNRRIGPYWKIFAVDTSDSTRKTQISYGASSDVQPSYSLDGSTIYFASDRGPNKVYNIFALDLQSGALAQHTDVVGGCFSPVEIRGEDDDRQLIFSAFYQGTFRLYRMPLASPETTLDLADTADEPVEPFEPPLQLSVDEDKKTPYQSRWDLAAPSISVGVTDDGTFLTNTTLQFSDLLGDQRVFVGAASVSTFSQIQATYVNFKRRANWGATVFDSRDFFLSASNVTGFNRDQIRRITGGNFFVQVPFSRYYRFETSAGVFDRSQDFVSPDPLTGGFNFTRFSDSFATLQAGFVGDTTRFQSWGPFQGKRFNVSALYGLNIGGDLEGDIQEYRLDFRAYKQLTRRSLLAWRLNAIIGQGEASSLYAFGGINQLRGFEYRDFFGSQVAWTNLEFRFPLIDELRFPILGLRNIRGFLFVDVGAAKLEDDLFYDPELRSVRFDPVTGEPIPFKFWDSDNDRLQDGRASYGFGFQFFFLGGLQFNWAWAKAYDYTQYVFDPTTLTLTPQEADTSDRRMDFYIVFDF